MTRLAAGAYSDEFADGIDAAGAMYSLDAVTQDMPDEGHWHMGRYITIQEAAWFGYVDDVTSSYENAPAFAGDDITYKMAGVHAHFYDLDEFEHCYGWTPQG